MTIEISRGDIVYLKLDQWVYRRPGLVIALSENDVLVAPLSRLANQAQPKLGKVVISGAEEGRTSGLRFDVLVHCDHLLTVNSQFIISKIGRVSDELAETIDSTIGEG